tara:strand:+ start:15285 stop:17990 length:2706 start_codon:yes stop_codon:yes gene_type:complete
MGKAVSKTHSCLARLGSAWAFNRVCLFLGILWLGHFYGFVVIYSQETGVAPKHAVALRVPNDFIRVDGRLNESIWETAVAITDFVQKEPDEGAIPTDRMEVRFVYDDSALYIGARMFSSGTIQAPLSRRDDADQIESFQVELDTYHDRRTAYMFGVTAAGVRLDHYHPNDDEGSEDWEYDPVWQARTSITEDGWIAELWLPFSQLRFNAGEDQIWGLNVKRYVPSRDEENYWALVKRTESGWSSRFGELHGIGQLQQPSRLEVLPYAAGSMRRTADRDLSDPFDDGKNLMGRVGADLKYGFGSNLTLDVTVNPDFGQIDADPAEVNLTVFETIFSERRPFFLEGNNVLTAGTGNYYYSRRIGARPVGPAAGEFVDYPNTTTILGAAKLTGRLPSGTSIGLLGAVTDDEFARTSIGNQESDVQVTPRTIWSVARIIQEVGDQGSTVGAHLTAVHRTMSPDDPLAAILSRNAVTAGADARLRFKDRTYEARFNVGITHIDGEETAIAGYQRRNSHLLQRIDQSAMRFDPTRDSMSGAQVTGTLSKIAGRHWLWRANVMIESPEFEPSDFGRLNFAGDVSGRYSLTYRETVPGPVFRGYFFRAQLSSYNYFDRDLGIRYNLTSDQGFTFLNFWRTNLDVTRYFRGQDAQLTRGGPVMGVPLGWNANWSLRSRAAAETQWSVNTGYQSNELGDYVWRYRAGLSVRPSPSLQLSVEPEYRNERGTRGTFSGPINRQYLATLPGGRPEVFGRRYVFGLPDNTQLSARFRVSYTFKPDMTLDIYAEPFAASGRYERFGETRAPRDARLRIYGTDGTTIERLDDGRSLVRDGDDSFVLRNYDFNVRSFRSNVVLRWEWRPGSTLFVVWQQNRQDRTSMGRHVGFGDLFESLSVPGDNIFAIKTTLWVSK